MAKSDEKLSDELKTAHITSKTTIIVALITTLSGWGIALATNFDKIFPSTRPVDPAPSLHPLHRLKLISIDGPTGLGLKLRFLSRVKSAAGVPITVVTTFPSERGTFQIGEDFQARDYPAWVEETKLSPGASLKSLNAEVDIVYFYKRDGNPIQAYGVLSQTFNFHLSHDLTFGQVYKSDFVLACKGESVISEETLRLNVSDPSAVPDAQALCGNHTSISVTYQVLE